VSGVVLPWAQWRRVWGTVGPFASKDPGLPRLLGARVWSDGAVLRATATDRYKAVAVELDLAVFGAAGGEPVDAFLTARAFRVMEAAMRGRPRIPVPEVSLSARDGGGAVWEPVGGSRVSADLPDPPDSVFWERVRGLASPPAGAVFAKDPLPFKAGFAEAVFSAASRWGEEPVRVSVCGALPARERSLFVSAPGFEARLVGVGVWV
jgi:hypothetical protein